MRLSTSVQEAHLYVHDSLSFVKRNRESWRVKQPRDLGALYFPSVYGVVLREIMSTNESEEAATNWSYDWEDAGQLESGPIYSGGLAVVHDRPIGVGNLEEGVLEFMLHRCTVSDDDKGVPDRVLDKQDSLISFGLAFLAEPKDAGSRA